MADQLDLLAVDAGLDNSQPVAGLDLLADPSAPGPFKRGLKTGVSNLRAIGGGILQYAGRATGYGALERKGQEIGEAAAEESAPYTMRVEDVGEAFDRGILPGLKSSADLVAYTIGSQIPMLATAAAGGVLGRVAAGAFGATQAMSGLSAAEKAAAVARTKAGIGSAADVAVTGATRAADIGAGLGVGAASTAMELGQIAPEGLKPENKAPLTQMAIGSLIAGATDTIIPVYLARKLGLIGAAERVLSPRRAGFGAVAREAGKTALKVGAGEAVQETAQSYIERLSANQPITGAEANSDAINSLVMGGIIGLVTGGLAGGVQGMTRPTEAAAVQPEAVPTEPEQPAVVATPEEQRLVAAQQMTDLSAGVDQARVAQETATARLKELAEERKKDFKERRPYPVIDAERKTLQDSIRESKKTVKTLEDQWFAAQKTVADLTPAVSPEGVVSETTLQSEYVAATQAALAASGKVASLDAEIAEKGKQAPKALKEQRAAAVAEQKATQAVVAELETQSYQLRQQVPEVVPEAPTLGPTVGTEPLIPGTVVEAPAVPKPVTEPTTPEMIATVRKQLQEQGFSADAAARLTPEQAGEALKSADLHPVNITPAKAVENIKATLATNPDLTPDQAHALNTLDFSELAKQALNERLKTESVARIKAEYGAPVGEFVSALPPTAAEQRGSRIADAMRADVAALVGIKIDSLTPEQKAKAKPETRAKLNEAMSGTVAPVVERALALPTIGAQQAAIKRWVPVVLKGKVLKEDAETFAKGLAEKVGAGTLYSRGQRGQQFNLTKQFQINEANREKTNALQAGFRVEGKTITITPVSVRDDVTQNVQRGEGGRGSRDHFELAEKISRVFGKQIIWVEVGGNSFHGVMNDDKGALSKYVFVNVRSNIPAHVIFGHELTHHMKADAPGVYADLQRAIKGLLRDHEEYRQLHNVPATESTEFLSEEMLGDLMGDNFGKREFWRLVAENTPSSSVFRAIADTISRWVGKILPKLRTIGYGSEQFVTDMNAARKYLAQAVVDYTEIQRGKGEVTGVGGIKLSRATTTAFSPNLEAEITESMERDGSTRNTAIRNLMEDMTEPDHPAAGFKKELQDYGAEIGIYKPHTREELSKIDVSGGKKYDFKRGNTFFIFDSWAPLEGTSGLTSEMMAKFRALADTQRGRPESAMNKAQHVIGGGVLSHVIEHAGDINHRMNEFFGWTSNANQPLNAVEQGRQYVVEKTEKVLRTLTNGYGFVREHDENMIANARVRGMTLSDQLAKARVVLEAYATEHEKLTTYNRPQELARQAAINLGRGQYTKATQQLQELHDLAVDKDAYTAAMLDIEAPLEPGKPTAFSRGAINDVTNSLVASEFLEGAPPEGRIAPEGTVMWHVTPRANRESIQKNGLRLADIDKTNLWLFPNQQHALASSTANWGDPNRQNDIWRVDVGGQQIYADPHPGWPDKVSVVVRQAIPATKLSIIGEGHSFSRAAMTQDDFDILPTPAKHAVTDEWNRIQMAKGTRIREEITRIVGPDPALVIKTFQATPDSPVGSYTRVDKYKAVITAALNASDNMSLAAHEGFHYAEDRLLTSAERQIVANAVKEGRPLYTALIERTQRYDRENQTNITDEVTSRPAEARAYAFQFWRLGQLQAEGPLARAFEKIRVFFERIKNMIDGLGFKSVEDIFAALDRGQFAERGGREQYGLGRGDEAFVSRGPDQAQTPEFKRWFGDSVVTDNGKPMSEGGKPLVVYHGTKTGEFSTTGPRNLQVAEDSQGFFFARDPADASAYAMVKARAGETERGGSVIPAYLHIENPLYLDEMSEMHPAYISPSRRKKIEADGHDGIIYKNGEEIVVFRPEQIKSATGNTGAFDPTNPDIRFSESGAQTWYRSALTTAVAAMTTKAASAQGWKEQIKGLVGKNDVKQVEIDAVGLNEFLDLQKGKVTKDQVVSFLKENGVRVEELELGEMSTQDAIHPDEVEITEPRNRDIWVARAGDQQMNVPRQLAPTTFEAQIIAAHEFSRAIGREGISRNEPKFSQWQLPGGQNYRELALYLPSRMTERPAKFRSRREMGEWFRMQGYDHLNHYDGVPAELMAEFEALPGGMRADERQVPAQEWGGDYHVPPGHQMGGAADINRLAHIRFNERIDSEGKRVLFIEELQSDMAQAGRKQGFKGENEKYLPEVRRRLAAKDTELTTRERQLRDARDRSQGALTESDLRSDPLYHVLVGERADIAGQLRALERDDNAIPTAPFVTKTEAWVALSLKRMIRYAAENGYDRIAWTTGDQQAARYDLSKQVDKIEWMPIVNSTKQVVDLNVKNGGQISFTIDGGKIVHETLHATGLLGKSLDEVVGKEVAKKIEESHKGRLAGEGLKIGGEGMKAFYDRIIPNVANEVLRKLGGGRVETIRVGVAFDHIVVRKDHGWITYDPATEEQVSGPFPSKVEAVAAMNKNIGEQPGFLLTPELIQRVEAGVPLFSKAGIDFFGYAKILDKQRALLVGQRETIRMRLLDRKMPNELGARRLKEIQDKINDVATKQNRALEIAYRIEQETNPLLDSLTPTQRSLYSRAAIEATDEYNRRAAGGELTDLQVRKTAVEVMENASIPEDVAIRGFGIAKSEFAGGLKRWWFENIARPELVSRYSTGYRNVMRTLGTYIRYRKILAEQMLRERLPSWYKASDDDRSAAFSVMLKRTVERYGRGSKELAALYDPLTDGQKKLFNEATDMIAGFLNAEFAADQVKYREWYTTPGKYEKWEAARREWVADMIDKGYVPLKRYGDHTVYMYMLDAKGKRISAAYQFFDSPRAAQWAAGAYETEIKRLGVNMQVEVGMRQKNMRETGMSIDQFLGNLERNGVPLQQAAKERLVEALTNTDSIVRNRMMHRDNLPGYSDDSMRVIHEFGVGMASKLAYSAFGRAIDAAASGAEVTADVDYVNSIPKIAIGEARGVDEAGVRNNLWERDGPMSGFYKNISDELNNFVLVPDHSGQWSTRLRAGAMTYFIGGSISGAMVNTMSIPMLTVPELSIHTNYLNSMTTTMTAWKDAWRYYHILSDTEKMKDPRISIPGIDPQLKQAILAASDAIFDTEIHQMLGMSQGTVYSKSRTVQKAMEVWMKPFRISEQTNRLTAFIAAYRIASTDPNFKQIDIATGELTGKTGAIQGQELFKFAHHIVNSTQNNYSEENRPGAARNPIFAIIMMFKSFPLFMIEAVHLMYKASPAAARNMLLGLVLLTGVQGLPFAETLEDLIDTIAQQIFGSSFNTRKAMINVTKQASEALVGVDLSELVMWGALNAIAGVSASSRIGSGDFVPGTRLGTADADQGRVLAEIAGAPYAMVRDVIANAGGLFTTDWKDGIDAMRAGGPIAIRNLIKGSQQLYDGYASDAKGRNIVDVSTFDGLLQLTGLSSAQLAKAYQYESINLQSKAFYNKVSADMQNALVKAMRAGDVEKIQEISDLRNSWNENNPGMPILPNAAAVRRNLMLSEIPLDRRSQLLWGRRIRGENFFNEDAGN